MSILTQNSTNEVALLDCIQRFFSKHHVGEILKKCNGTKEKGIPAISLIYYNRLIFYTSNQMEGLCIYLIILF